MFDNKALVLDLVAWIDGEPKAYDEVMAAWRTSCPRSSSGRMRSTTAWWPGVTPARGA